MLFICERKILKLSDSFANNNIKACMELEVLQLNINYGHNKEIMKKCKVLGEYAVFISKVKKYKRTMMIEEAVDRAVKECIQEDILKEILISHQAEVKDMILTEYDEEKTMRLFQKEYEEEAAEKIAKARREAAAEVAQAKQEVEQAKQEVTQAKQEVTQAKQEVTQIKQELQQMQMEIENLKKQLETQEGKK